MDCPDVGTLRTYLDGVAAAGDRHALSQHLTGCAGCRSTLAELRRCAGLAAPVVNLLAAPESPSDEDVEARLARVAARRTGNTAVAGARTRAGAGGADVLDPDALVPDAFDPDVLELGGRVRSAGRPERDGTRSFPGRWAALPTGLRAAAVLVLVAATFGAVAAIPAGRSAAAEFLDLFRSERLAVVTVDPDSPGLRQSMQALQSIGTVDTDALSADDPDRVRTLAEASRQVGFQVRGADPADLPRGTGDEPAIYVKPAQDVRFTFDREKASRFVAEHGRDGLDLPTEFDGASLTVRVPAAAFLAYPGPDGAPEVIVAQAGQVRASTEGGVTLAEMRELLLSLPGLPDETVRQLRGISDWRTTLPVLVPVGKVNWERTTVNGADALTFSGQGDVVNVVIWQRDDRIYGVGGPIGSGEVQRVAAGLG